MAILGIKVDVDGPRRAFQNLRSDQLPWTIARALTMTAQAGQAGARKLEGEIFTLRNDWTVSNTKIAAATKQNLVATVFTNTSNSITRAPDYLEPQQDGGEKVPHNGRMHIAIPTKYLRFKAPGVIPEELRPRNLLAAMDGSYTVQRYKRRGDFKYKQDVARRQVRVSGMVFFVVTLKSGTLAIVGRAEGDNEVWPFYVLVPEANIRPIFPMSQTVADIAEAVFAENFSKAALETIGNDLLRGSGLKIKL